MANLQELELDEIAEWPLLPQLAVLLLLVLALQGAGYWLYMLPKQDALEGLKQQEQTLKSTIRIKASKVATLPKLKTQLDELAERYDFLLRQLPVQKELASMLASVNELGLENTLTFTRIDWGEAESGIPLSSATQYRTDRQLSQHRRLFRSDCALATHHQL